jgi:hypothetical protein
MEKGLEALLTKSNTVKHKHGEYVYKVELNHREIPTLRIFGNCTNCGVFSYNLYQEDSHGEKLKRPQCLRCMVNLSHDIYVD